MFYCLLFIWRKTEAIAEVFRGNSVDVVEGVVYCLLFCFSLLEYSTSVPYSVSVTTRSAPSNSFD